jgi:hypothetical protein
MSLLWDRYVFRKGQGVDELWDDLYRFRKTRPLLVAGCGFDVRVRTVLERFLQSARVGRYQFEEPTLLLIEYSGYELDEALQEQTSANCKALRTLFEPFGRVVTMTLQLTGDEEHRTSRALREAALSLSTHIAGRTDILLDVSSLPRVLYLALMTSLLGQLVPDIAAPRALVGSGVNLQVLVAEDATLDSAFSPKIRAKIWSPSLDLVVALMSRA